MQENVKSLIAHIVEQYLAQGAASAQHSARLQEHTYTDTFTQLKRKHEQVAQSCRTCDMACKPTKGSIPRSGLQQVPASREVLASSAHAADPVGRPAYHAGECMLMQWADGHACGAGD